MFKSSHAVLILGLLSFTNTQHHSRPNNNRNNWNAGGGGPLKNLASVPQWASSSITHLTFASLQDIHLYTSTTNIIISPLSIWSVLLMTYEASGGGTEEELKNLLHVESKAAGRSAYEKLYRSINSNNGNTVQISTANLIASTVGHEPKPDFQSAMRNSYKGEAFVIDPNQQQQSSQMINNWVRQHTNQRIQEIIQPGDINSTQILLANAAFFKGKWKYPFDVKNTTIDVFKNESDAVIGEVSMMRQKITIPYGFSPKLQSNIVEIPYADDVASMIVILPRKTTRLAAVLAQLRHMTMDELMSQISPQVEVDLHIPRFNVINDFDFNYILERLGLRQMFAENEANFPQFTKPVYVSKVVHKAEIENSEEGTTASAATSVQFADKFAATRFQANRPFLYLIKEKKSDIVLFAGAFVVPS